MLWSAFFVSREVFIGSRACFTYGHPCMQTYFWLTKMLSFHWRRSTSVFCNASLMKNSVIICLHISFKNWRLYLLFEKWSSHFLNKILSPVVVVSLFFYDMEGWHEAKLYSSMLVNWRRSKSRSSHVLVTSMFQCHMTPSFTKVPLEEDPCISLLILTDTDSALWKAIGNIIRRYFL